MSAFLGPIHHWLFKKIVLFEQLEQNILNSLSKEYGEEVINIGKSTAEFYGSFIPQEPLEQLIDTGNIHGWLQSKITIAETRQAATLKKLIETFGVEIIEKIKQVYIDQGAWAGKEAAQHGQVDNAPFLYKTLNNYLLDGMPCDNVNSVSTSEPDLLVWNTFRCLHKPFWNVAQADVEVMYALRFSWIKSFVENANSAYTYVVERTGEDGFINKIIKRSSTFIHRA